MSNRYLKIIKEPLEYLYRSSVAPALLIINTKNKSEKHIKQGY